MPPVDELDQEIPLECLPANKRVVVRYKRKDIKAVIKVRSLLYPRLLPVVLNDISSKGAGIICTSKIGVKSRVSLYLLFDDGCRFDIDAVIVYCRKSKFYGLKFNRYHDSLAEHLYDTHSSSKFN